MAIGFNLPGIPSQIRGTPEEAGALPNLQQAIMQGFGSGLQMQYAPKQMAQDFLAKQLTNKMLGIEAQYAEPMAKTSYDKALFDLASRKQLLPLELQAKQAKINLAPLEQQFKQAQIKTQLAKAAKDSGIIAGMPEGNIPLSAGTKKEHEGQITSIDAVGKNIESLIGFANEKGGVPGLFAQTGARRAQYDALVKGGADLLSKAMKTPAFERAFKGMEVNLKQGLGENDEAYINRLLVLYNRLGDERNSLTSQIKYGISSKEVGQKTLQDIIQTPNPKKTAQDLSPEELIKLKQYRMQQRGA